MAGNINSDEQLEAFIELLRDIEAADILTSDAILSVIAQANEQKEWIQTKAEQIYPYFGLIVPTPTESTEDTEEPTTTTTETTPSSSTSVIASFAIIAACAVVKMFV